MNIARGKTKATRNSRKSKELYRKEIEPYYTV